MLRVGMNIACVNFSLDKKRLSPPRLWPCQQLFAFFLGQRFKTVIMSNIPVEKKTRKTRNTLKTESSVIELLGSFCFLLQLSWRREVAPKYISSVARSIACWMLPSSRTITDFQSILQTYCLETWPERRSSGVFSSVVPNLIAVSRTEIWGRGECEPWTRKTRDVMVKMIPHLIKAYIKAWPCENKNILAPWIIFICHVAIICWYIWDSQSSSVTLSCPTLCDPVDSSTPGFPVHRQLPEFTQTHVHYMRDAIQPSHPLSSLFLLLSSIFPSIRVLSNESALRIRWPKY